MLTVTEFQTLLQKNLDELIWRNKGWGPIPIHGKGVTGWSVKDRINYHTAKAKSSTKETDIERHDAMAKKLSATVKSTVSKTKKIGSPSEIASPLAENDKTAGSRTYKNQEEFNKVFDEYKGNLRTSLENTSIFKEKGILPVIQCGKGERGVEYNGASNLITCRSAKDKKTDATERVAKKMQGELPVLDSYIHPEVARKVNVILTDTTRKQRSFAQGNKIFMNKQASDETYLHEFGHGLENMIDSSDKSKLWLNRRVKGTISLNKVHSGYGKNEIARINDFIDPYVGKIYSHKGTEVISMGLQQFTNPAKLRSFAEKDFDHFAYTMGIIQGAL